MSFLISYLIRIHFLRADVIDLSSGEDDHIVHSSSGKKEEVEESEPSGAHTNDALNQPDAQGRVLVNLNHPAEEEDIFLLPHLTRAVKPHQVSSLILEKKHAARLVALHRFKEIIDMTLPFIIFCLPQIGGIRFLYDNLVESVERFSSSTGFGCILAHSMGLGKTLQVISFIDVLFRHTQTHTVLAIVPVSTVQRHSSGKKEGSDKT